MRIMNALKKIIAPELVDAIGFPRIKWVGPSRNHNRRKNRLAKQRLLRKLEAREREIADLKRVSVGIYPPQRGSRRPEFSSATPGQWSPIHGAPSNA